MIFISEYGFLSNSVKCCGHCGRALPATRCYFYPDRAWIQTNLPRIRIIQQKSLQKKRATPEGKLIRTVQKGILDGLAGKIKTSRSEVLLGCSFLEFKNHLEKQFSPFMSWENHGSYWHVDHILPKSAFNLQHSEEQEICFHWSNQRPLRASDNLAKGDKII